ncbi:MAG: CBS domain-containing protein [Actinomycetes bacterium]
MSPRAAWRLETLGFDAYDYVAGKADWLAFGLPYEGDATLAGGHLTTDVATCSVDDRLADIAAQLEASRFGVLVVLNANGIVLGRLNRTALDADHDHPVTDLMREGPTTVRPSEELGPLLERMGNAEVDAVLVTRSDGRLLGMLERTVAQQALDEEEADDADR